MNTLKKLFSVVLALALFSTMFFSVLPVSASEIPDGVTYDYAFYDFNEGEVISFTANTGSSTDSKGNTFYPLLAKGNASLTQENITVADGESTKTVSALKLSSDKYSQVIITDKNGKPFEARENVTYKVTVNAYIKKLSAYGQVFYGFGFHGSDSPNYKTDNESLSFVDQRRGNAIPTSANHFKAMYPKYLGGNGAYYSASAREYDDYLYSTNTFTYTTTNLHADYVGENFVSHDAEGEEYPVDNYFGLFFPVGSSSIVYIDSIEIYATDSAAKVTTYDGDTLLDVSYVANGSTLPAAPAKEGYSFMGWYTDSEFNNPYVSSTVDGYNLTLYARYIDLNAKYSVSYFNGSELVKTEMLKPGEKLWDGSGVDDLYLSGWYTDAGLTQPYESLISDAEDMSLYGNFKTYDSDLTIDQFTYTGNKVNRYYTYNNKICNEYDLGGWGYKGVTDGNIVFSNTQNINHRGNYIIHHQDTGNAFVPEPGATYEITATYTVDAVDGDYCYLSAGFGVKKEYYTNQKGNAPIAYTLFSGENYLDAVDGVQTETVYITVPEKVADNELSCLTICFNSIGRDNTDSGNKIQITVESLDIKKIDYGNALTFDGASILTDEIMEENGSQAMRVFFSYNINENGKIVLNGDEKNIVARGIMLKATDNEVSLEQKNAGKNGIINVMNTENLDKCWSYDEATGKVTFSMYITGFNENDERSISMRSYIVTEDGITVYSKIRSRSVKQITDATINSVPTVENEKEKIAIMLVIGQSNSTSAGYSEELSAIEVAGENWVLSEKPTTAKYGAVYMANYGYDGITTLGPESEYSINYRDTEGGFAPAYAAKYYELTGQKVVIVPTGVGGTQLEAWQRDCNDKNEDGKYSYKGLQSEQDRNSTRGWNESKGYFVYDRAVTAYNNTYDALKEQYDIVNSFYVWNQGENDEMTHKFDPETNTVYNEETYAYYFEKMHKELLEDCPGLTNGTIIAVRSCRTFSNSLGGTYPVSGASTYARRAQYRVASKRDDINLVSWVTESCQATANYKNGLPEGVIYGRDYDVMPTIKGSAASGGNMHYTQIRYNEMGADGAVNYCKILNGTSVFDGVAVRDANGTLIGKFDTQGNGNFSITNDSTIGTQFLQIRPEDASCTYDFALHVDKETSTLTIDVYTDGSHPESGDQYISEYGKINWGAIGSNTLNIVCVIR